MRKVKIELTAKVPSWHFCNLDKSTLSLKVSNELCRFCHKTKDGYKCSLWERWLTHDRGLVDKAPQCRDIELFNPTWIIEDNITEGPQVDPQLVIQETLKTYKKTVKDLMAQGYPQNLAETIAEQYTLGGTK